MKKLTNKLLNWLNAEDTSVFDNAMELKMQEPKEEKEETVEQRMRDRLHIKDEVYSESETKEVKVLRIIYRTLAIILCAFIAYNLLIAVSWLPRTGEFDKPVNNEVSARYIEKGLQETGAVNIVTGMILDYRAFDTFGESNVLNIATITVLILLRRNKKKLPNEIEEKENDRLLEPKNDVILQKAATFLVPAIFLFGIYVILNGHLSPGGGFSGGAIIGAGLILYVSAFGFEKTEKFFTEKTQKVISLSALLFYCLAKSYSFFTGANELESHIPLGKAGAILSSGLILPLNICVGLVVAVTMYTFYCMFRKGEF
ncbi:multicomponent Na+:H+ antiporter subunit B [Lachnospiraceae bacterium G11]|jgi:multicomponent Na+:H+ antiporter subunit B|nr:multicomponent Na+:H+ antiporter subunit B [Lachnospiraceae bacterium G11]